MENAKELASALANLEAATKKGCGCGGPDAAVEDNPFASVGDPFSAELASALDALGAEDREFRSDRLSAAELASREFSEIDMGAASGLDEILSIAERYPGLKITFSF
ncbi:MAG TPA: hypothetical protein VFR51_19775 [Pyrinomonadaceae bacterium]|nr:hypothetical protein [Pyrinomonadaceae bacterium]